MRDEGVVQQSRGRIAELDGLRGMAALCVVLHHFLCAFLPRLTGELTPHPARVADSPLSVLWNGRFSVSIFFVLSGFVIAAAAKKHAHPLYANLILRWLRLAIPATASTLFAWTLLKAVPDAARRLSVIDPSNAWLTRVYQNHIPGFMVAFLNGLLAVFIVGVSVFNNSLWTMRIEAAGSMGIFVLYAAPRKNRRALFLVLTVLLAALHPDCLGFALGLFLMEAWEAGKLTRRVNPWLTLTLGILLGFPSQGFAARLGLPQMPGSLTLGNPDGVFPPIAAALIVYSILNSPWMRRLLSGQICQYFGRISFPLYLVHVPFIYTIVIALYLWGRERSLVTLPALFVFYFASVVLLAHLGEALVDRPLLKWLHEVRASVAPKPTKQAQNMVAG